MKLKELKKLKKKNKLKKNETYEIRRSGNQIRKYEIRNMKSIPIANPRNDQMS